MWKFEVGVLFVLRWMIIVCVVLGGSLVLIGVFGCM